MQDVFTMQPSLSGDGTEELLPTKVRPRSLDAFVPVRHLLPPRLVRLYPDPRFVAA